MCIGGWLFCYVVSRTVADDIYDEPIPNIAGVK